MAGIWQGKRFWSRKIKSENEPPRSVRGGGRKGCLGSDKDPFPGTYHVANCGNNREKTWWDRYKNQKY